MGKAEILHQIKEAEAKVRAMTKEAEEKWKQLQAEGKRRALEMTEKAEAENAAKNDLLVAAASVDIAKSKKVALEEGAKRASTRAASARKKISAAEDLVLSEFERAADA